MAIEWGAWEGSSPTRIRVGIDASWENVTHGEGAATCTIKIYTDVEGNWGDTQTLSFGGSIGGSVTFSNNQSNNSVLRETKTYTYNYGNNEYGSSPGSRTFSASLSGAWNGATPSKSVTTKIPARPYAAPAAPTNVNVSRVSDTSQKVTWTNKATSGEPWDRVRVQWDIVANDVWNGDVGTPGGGSTSFTDSGTSANEKYRYRVRSENSVGNSAYIETAVVYTTPAAPTGCSRSQSGSDQIVTWANQAGYGEYNTQVWRSVDGVWSLLATKTAGTTSHTDVAPDATKKIKYKVRHITTTGAQGTLYSSYSGETTETPGITSVPNAPTGLSPAGISVDPTLPQTWSWQHNSTDSSTQQAYELRHRLVGTTTWTTATGTTASSHTIAADTYPEQVSVEWQVRTRGANLSFSPWSEPVQFQTSVAAIAPDPVKIPMVLDLHTGRMEASTTAYELRNMVMRIQSNLMGGGVRTVDTAYNISWSQRFIAISLGNSKNALPGGHHDIVNPFGWGVTNKALTSNVATLTYSSALGGSRIRVGDRITVTGVGTPFDGEWIAREVTTNTVKYDVVAPNVASVASAGAVFCTIHGHGGAANAYPSSAKITMGSWQALYYEIPFGWGAGNTPRKNGVVRATSYSIASNVVTLTVVAPHYFTVGDRVHISGTGTVLDGENRTITGITSTTITFSLTATNAGTTALPTGSLVNPSGKDTFFSNFHLVYYTQEFVVPDNWVLIAMRNTDAATVEWGTGDTVDPGYDSDSPVFKQAIFTSTTDASTAAGNKPPLRIGPVTGNHLRVDGNEIISMANDSSPSGLNLNISGGAVNIASSSAISEFRGTVEFPHIPTTTAGANLNGNASLQNRLRLVSSLSKWKLEQEEIDLETARGLLGVKAKTWYDRSEVEENDGSTEGLRRVPGFIAEDLAKKAPLWATYNDDGALNGVAYDRVTAGLLVLVQEQQATIEDLRSRLERLEGGK